ncbi:ornithine carbamoyltransferase [Starmerella bacillaris]|uniref:ornithine carbamoyltransferase n=1 Tax=Starmerella bacillaris TaxID=1247836 RepID=A0AAV5RQM4_STABA|nr:ornithine carbamoyltransferase [Starmerella bacillaris]
MARHFISIADLSVQELKYLVDRGIAFKKAIRAGNYNYADFNKSASLKGQQIPLLFSKRSTRTRISSEGAITYLGGSPMFLGRDDIQLGVNESFYDTTKVVSSMTSAIIARVGPHSEIQELATHSRVPVINALCEKYHPMQAVADMITIKETFGKFEGLKVAWVGDANNVVHDLALACVKLGIDISVATPVQYPVSDEIVNLVAQNANNASMTVTTSPVDAVKNADVIVTDTWISMGQESEKVQKLKEFAGFQVTEALGANAKPGWKFMHCLPRHNEEVDDEVFYGDRSVVFEEAENRLYSAISVIEGFVINKGKII